MKFPTVEGALLVRETNWVGPLSQHLKTALVLADEVVRLRRMLHDRGVDPGCGDSSGGSERLPSKQEAAGSSPAPRTIYRGFKC